MNLSQDSKSKKVKKIREDLINLSDEKYRQFAIKLIPNIDSKTILGIRTPVLRDYAKKSMTDEEKQVFINDLPHKYNEENALHMYILETISKDPDVILNYLDEFLPYANNWAVTDSFKTIRLKKHIDLVEKSIEKWIASDETYTVRFGVAMALKLLLGNYFSKKTFDEIVKIKSEEYYINIAIAWYICEAIIKNYDYAIKIIESQSLDKWINNKAIQKCVESYRVTDDQKTYLRSLKK